LFGKSAWVAKQRQVRVRARRRRGPERSSMRGTSATCGLQKNAQRIQSEGMLLQSRVPHSSFDRAARLDSSPCLSSSFSFSNCSFLPLLHSRFPRNHLDSSPSLFLAQYSRPAHLPRSGTPQVVLLRVPRTLRIASPFANHWPPRLEAHLSCLCCGSLFFVCG
jgi:hypothetical protein